MRILLTTALLASFGLGLTATAQEGTTTEASSRVSITALKKTGMEAWQSQDWKTVAKSFAAVVENKPGDHEAWYRLGYSLHVLGKLDSAIKAHIQATASTNPRIASPATYNVACVHAMQGRKDAAFKWLDKAKAAGFSSVDTIINDSDMDNLRGDPRFKAFVKSLGKGKKGGLTAYHNPSTRGAVRIAYFGAGRSGGQVNIDFGTPAWKDKYTKALTSDNFKDQRWRVGQNFWTNLDTCIPMTVGGKEIPVGLYYLTLEHKSDGRFLLAFNDPKIIRKMKLDAFVARNSKGGIEVEMKHSTIDKIAKNLKFDLVKNKKDDTMAKLVIHFGPHQFTTKVKMHVE